MIRTFIIKAFIFAFYALIPAHTVTAQIDISCRLEQSRVVQHEPVRAAVRIQNNTAHTLRISDREGDTRLIFDIERSPGRLAVRTEEPLIGDEVVIPPRRSETIQVVLNEAYDMRYTGPYTVRARLRWGGTSFSSGSAFLDIVPGLEVTRITAAASPDGQSYRTYRILSLNRDRGEHLFLRIDDPGAGMNYGVIHLGRFIRQFTPKLETDGSFNVHVLHQSGPARYAHHVFSPAGRMLNRRYYGSHEGRVGFEEGPDGSVNISGATASFAD